MGSLFNAPKLRMDDNLRGFQGLRQALYDIQKNIGISRDVASGITQSDIALAQRFGPVIQELQSQAISRDPLLGPFRQQLIGTLSADENLGRVRTNVRQSLAARGLNIRDPAGAVAEAAALSTAGEERRLGRLNVVGQFLGLGTTQQVPQISGLTSVIQGLGFPERNFLQQQQQTRLGVQSQNLQFQQQRDAALGQLAVQLGGAAIGGAASSAGGMGFLPGFAGSITGMNPQSFIGGGGGGGFPAPGTPPASSAFPGAGILFQ